MIVLLKGGLGNQLFQVSYGFWLEKKFGLSCRFSKVSYSFDRKRLPLVLDIFPQLQTCTPMLDMILLPFVLQRVAKYPVIKNYVHTDGKNFDLPRSFVASGYFQDFEHTKLIVSALKNWIFSSQPYAHEPYVAVHIRRTDFLASKNTHDEYKKLISKYYGPAISYATRTTGIKKVAIISDDPEGAISDINLIPEASRNIEFYNGSSQSERDDLYTMANANFLVASNSTFAWWAARMRPATSSLPQLWVEREKHKVEFSSDLHIPGIVYF